MSSSNVPFVFFGSPQFAVDILEELKQTGFLPSLVVTAPDKPKGRGQKVTSPPVGMWAKQENISILQPEEITESFITKLKELSPDDGWPLFVVVAYGHILPPEVIYLPEHNTLNVHPSLLPKLRGSAPVRGAILQEDKTGVSIIELDEKMDHGPIVAQTEVMTETWPPTYPDLLAKLAISGGQLLADTIPQWVNGDTEANPQDHEQATYIDKFTSADGEIDLSADPEENLRKIRAFTNWPKAHFFADGKRVLITKAHLEEGELVIDTVKPSGGEEISYQEWREKYS